MTEQEYVEVRLDDQISWYDQKSLHNQAWFKRLQIFAILGSSTIPFLAGLTGPDSANLKLATGVLGLGVAAATAVLGLYKFQENWIRYRTAAESLKHEKFLFLTRADPYHGEKPFVLLVQRVEAMISSENSNWSQYMRRTREPSK